MKQRRRVHCTGNKYDPKREIHQYNNRVHAHQGTIVEPTAQHIAVLSRNLQVLHQSNVVIEPATVASL